MPGGTMRRLLLIGFVALGFLISACGAARQSGICGDINPPATATGDVREHEAKAEAAWAQRGELEQARSAIEHWNMALAIDPSRHDIRVKLAQAHYFVADSHLFIKQEIEKDASVGPLMLEHYQEGQFQAEMALGQRYPGYRTRFCGRQPFESALQQLDRDAVPAMYWYATNLGRYALATSLVEVLNHRDRIYAMMNLVARLDPSYWYHASDRYFGVYYTRIPFPSGDLPLSAKHFERTVSSSPEYLASKVLYARDNLAKSGDRERFKQLLEEVVAFDLDSAPDIRPENAAEQRKARYFLEEIDFLVEED